MKNINNFNLEILSPAGSPESFYADINSGADAIYLGLSTFNARMKAENFTTQNIMSFIKYAHLMGVKIYVTVNTLIKDSDIEEFYSLIKTLVNCKVDAFIVQDLGVVYLLKNRFENIVIHASTQMGIHNLEGAIVAQNAGITRIVLSRETKLEDIKLIHQNTNLEIEYFVQGALCVAFSGNCYLSSVEKNMSGNEGKCLQLCRLPYTSNLSNSSAYYLSARDLSLVESLPELIEAGVTSFKIEGRMRHPGYCALTTYIYKQAILKIKDGSFSKAWAIKQYDFLRETFSRGEFNKRAYLDNIPSNIINIDFQNHIGTQIGKVLSIKKFNNDLYKVVVSSKVELHNNDGIKIINLATKEQVASLGIGNVTKNSDGNYEFVTKHFFKANLSVFLTQNYNLEKEILSLTKKLPIEIQISAFSGKNIEVTASYLDVKTQIKSDYLLEKGKNITLTQKDFETQFEKMNDLPFILSKLSLETDGIFLPKSMINDLRRKLLTKLQEEIIKSNEKNITCHEINEPNILNNIPTHLEPKNIAIIDEYYSDYDSLTKFDIIVLSPTTYDPNIIISNYNNFKEKFALSLPTIANGKDMIVINNILSRLPKNIYLFVNNIYGLYFAKEYKIIISPLLNVKNHLSIALLNELNIKTICGSIEADEDFCNKNNLITFSGGPFPLMTFAHCPFKTIYQNNCENCTYQDDLEIKNDNLGTYKIKRKKISNCYFHLNKYFLPKNTKFCLFNFCKH